MEPQTGVGTQTNETRKLREDVLDNLQHKRKVLDIQNNAMLCKLMLHLPPILSTIKSETQN